MGSGRRGTARRLPHAGAVPDPVILELRYSPPESSLDQAGDAEAATRADLARELNASIYKAGQSCAQEDEEFELTFFCACGCMAAIKRSLRDYVTRGAVLAGHTRPADHR